MDLSELERGKRKNTKGICIYVPESASKFMKEKNLSPTKIFMSKLQDIGYKE